MQNNMIDMSANPYMVQGAKQSLSLNEELRHESGNAIAANAEARVVSEVKAQVILAKQYPRNTMECATEILKECERPTLAEAAVYAFPRGREMVTGPSIRLAEVLARNWGNNTYGLQILERKTNDYGVGSSVVRAFAWDLQTNTYISREFELKHWRATKSGGYALTDDRDIYELEANMGSRRMRACILQMIPGDVTAAAVAACRKTTSSGLSEGMKKPESRARLIAGTVAVYEKMGIAKTDLENFLSAREQDWTAEHMLKLKELKNSLDDGQTALSEVFPHLAVGEKSTGITKEQVKELMELAKKTGRQGEISDNLKVAGIAKFADIQQTDFQSIKEGIEAMLKAEDTPKTEPAKKDEKATKSKAPDVEGEKLPWDN